MWVESMEKKIDGADPVPGGDEGQVEEAMHLLPRLYVARVTIPMTIA